MLIVDTHVERSTSKLVESVRLRRERQLQVVENIFNAIDSVVEKLISLLNNSDLIHSYNNQKELFEMNQHLLSSLGKCSKSHRFRRIFKWMPANHQFENSFERRVILNIEKAFLTLRSMLSYQLPQKSVWPVN